MVQYYSNTTNMKANKYIAILVLVAAAFTACDKHDSLDDQTFIGKMAPQVYWDVPGLTVNAGDSVAFSAQYYTTGERPISHLEVWYNTIETEEKQVSAPWVTSATYTFVSSQEIERQPENFAQARYLHNESFWVDSLHAYVLSNKFPTSYTRSKIQFGSADWDSTSVIKYFGEEFMQHFKDSLETILKADPDKSYADYKQLYINTGGDEKVFVAAYGDSIFNENTQKYDYVFKYDSVTGTRPIPAAVDSFYQSCTFKDLIWDKSKTEYSISYKKQFKLNAVLRCYDDEGTYGTALYKEITLN